MMFSAWKQVIDGAGEMGRQPWAHAALEEDRSERLHHTAHNRLFL